MVHAADHAMFTAKNAGRGEAALAPPRPSPHRPSHTLIPKPFVFSDS
jgi:hypothetical protein